MISTPPSNIITQAIRNNITHILREGGAHVRFEDAVEGLPAQFRSQRAPDMPYSIWQLVEHIRITLEDILQFSKSAEHKSPPWPQGYWTNNPDFVDDVSWENSVRQVRKDKDSFIGLFNDPDVDIYIPFSYGSGKTYIDQALFIIGHNSYHIGQIVLLRKIFGVWER